MASEQANVILKDIDLLKDVDATVLTAINSSIIDCRNFKAINLAFNCDITGTGTLGNLKVSIVHYTDQAGTEGIAEGWDIWTGLNTYTTNGENLVVTPGTQLATGGTITAAQVATLIPSAFVKFSMTPMVASDATTSLCRLTLIAQV